MKKIFINIFWGIVIFAVIGYFGMGHINKVKEEKAQQKLETEKKEKIKKDIKDIITKYNAITNWRKGLIYTSQLQTFLQNANERPVFISGTISDIEKKQSDYVLYLKSEGLFTYNSYILCELSISPEQYKKILAMIGDSGNYNNIWGDDGLGLGVVALIKEIKKPSLFIDAEAESAEEARVEINLSYVIIKGNCLALFEENYSSLLFDDYE